MKRAALVGFVLLLATACSSTNSTEPNDRGQIAAQVASYDLAANSPQRFMVGLLDGRGAVVIGGRVRMQFSHLNGHERGHGGTADDLEATGTFLPVAGARRPDVIRAGQPRLSDGYNGAGVYATGPLTFPAAGTWGVMVTGRVDGKSVRLDAAFDVGDTNTVPSPGSAAPLTDNRLPTDRSVRTEAVDSRSERQGSVPDPTLHEITIKAAVAARKPTVVVVSTPVFCISRFCGPITDSVEKLSKHYAGQVAFVHLEVWRNYDRQQLNADAADWIYPGRQGDATEPWVFLIGRDGKVAQRFDNVVSDAQLAAAVNRLSEAA